MSEVRQESLIQAPVSAVWDLVGDPRRYPEWWPRVVEVQGKRFDTGEEFVQVMRQPLMGATEAHFLIDEFADLRQISMHCTITGTFTTWRLTDAQGDTFLDVSFGMDPVGAGNKVFDRTLGRRFFRRWLEESVDALRRVATTASDPRLR